MTNLTDPRAVRTKQSLEKGLLKLLSKKDVSDIGIRELVDAAGIGYTTFYRHYDDVDSLLNEIVEEQMSALFSVVMGQAISSDIRSAVIALFSYVHKNRRVWKVLVTGGAVGSVRQNFLEKARKAGTPMANKDLKIPMEYALTMIASGMIEALDWWLRSKDPVSVERMAEIYDLTIVTPIIKANGIKI